MNALSPFSHPATGRAWTPTLFVLRAADEEPDAPPAPAEPAPSEPETLAAPSSESPHATPDTTRGGFRAN